MEKDLGSVCSCWDGGLSFFGSSFDQQVCKKDLGSVCNCWEDGLGQFYFFFFGSHFDQLMWRRAYLGSDLQLLGRWPGPNRQLWFVRINLLVQNHNALLPRSVVQEREITGMLC